MEFAVVACSLQNADRLFHLGFEDAHITFAVDGAGDTGTFESRILIDPAAESGAPLRVLTGRWTVRGGLALTAIVL